MLINTKFKLKTILFIILIFASSYFLSACSAGGEAMFSPDPSVSLPETVGEEGGADEPVVGPAEEEESGEDDGENEEKGETKVESKDCFELSFCHRECADASNCPAGFSCIMNVCTFDCQSDAECGTGGVCNEVGLCEPKTGEKMAACKADAECGSERFCNASGECEKVPMVLGCQNDAACPIGKFCDLKHECVSLAGVTPENCAGDKDCPSSFYCGPEGECKQDCRVDISCAAGEACAANGKCVAVGAPAKIVSFNFNAVGADTDPAGPVSFTSENFRIDSAAITIAGRNAMLTSPRFKLTGSVEY